MSDKTSYTASEARSNLYSLLKKASQGSRPIEIRLRGTDPVVLISKSEIEAIEETVEILSIPGARESIKAGVKQAKKRQGIPLSKLKK